MKVSHLKVHNFRSIRDLELDVPDMLVLLGPNNHGKSNILSALEFGLSTSAKVAPEDLFSFRSDEDSSMWVELTFDGLTEQEGTTFQRYRRSDDSIRIRKTADLGDGGSVDVRYNGFVQEPDEWWLKSTAASQLTTRAEIEERAQEVPALNALLEEGGRITHQRVEEFQQSYIREHASELRFSEILEQGPLLGSRNVAGGVLPEFFLVPAVRDLTDETKVKTTTVFGRLLQRAVREMAERNPTFVELRQRLQQLIERLNARGQEQDEAATELSRLEVSLADELASWGVGVSIEVIPPELERIFELGTKLHLDDGIKTLAERKGHGLQRAVLFALLRAWAKALRPTGEEGEMAPRRASESVYFAMEEPELFLHPHAQRQLFKSLEELGTASDHQVFICTHSTHFVDLEKYHRIAIVTKPSPQTGTVVRQRTTDLFAGEGAGDRKRKFHMAAWINPDRGELFFAKKVILVEGESEKALIPFLAEKLECLDTDVSVIDCGGKHNLSLYIPILNAFNIPYCVVHDQDPLPTPLPSDWTEGKRAAAVRLWERNERIAGEVTPALGHVEMFKPDMERVAGISQSQADKKGKALAALDHFGDIGAAEIPERLAEVVRAAFRVATTEVAGQ